MGKSKRDWRRQIDEIIEGELLAAEFSKFDSISYCFPVSAEVLGMVHIENRYLTGHGHFAHVNVHLGIIHYQLSILQSKTSNQELWLWTLGHYNGDYIGFGIPDSEIHEDDSIEDKQRAISAVVDEISTTALPYIRERFQTIASITEFIERSNRPNEQQLCLALSLNGKVTQAKERANRITADRKVFPGNTENWQGFKIKFDEWLAEGAPVPDLGVARAKTLQAAADRSSFLANIPHRLRPTY